MARVLALIILAFVLAGCVASGPKFTDAPMPANNKSVIYVYRDLSTGLGGRDVYFYVNGKNVFDLTRKGYSYFYASPGRLELSAKWPWDVQLFDPPEVKLLDIKPGETRYFRFQTRTQFSFNGTAIYWGFVEVPADIARAEIATMAFQKQNTAFEF
jgi:hypothetical protein